MRSVQEKLLELADEKYADFQSGLVPTTARETWIGVRLPALRRFARTFSKCDECEAFLQELPHSTYDENMLHAVLLSDCRDFGKCAAYVERFLPYVDNWAVCDSLRPKVFATHRSEILPKIRRWIASDQTYTCRFGIEMLMLHFLGADFREEYLSMVAAVQSDAYYVRMMASWFFATALAKQWDAAIAYIHTSLLPEWTRAKAIQKACESLRLSDEQKTYLRSLK